MYIIYNVICTCSMRNSGIENESINHLSSHLCAQVFPLSPRVVLHDIDINLTIASD